MRCRIQTCAQNLQFLFANSVFIFSIRFAFSSFIFAAAIWFSCKLKCNILYFFASFSLHWLDETHGFGDVSSMSAMNASQATMSEWEGAAEKMSNAEDISIYLLRIQCKARFGRLAGRPAGWLAVVAWMIHVYTLFYPNATAACNRIGLMVDRQMI